MREEQREQAALECAQHIIKISRVHADEYRDSWFGGESNLAKDYMRIRNEVKRLREALAACKRVVEAACTLADALQEVEETHATREPSDGERRHLMGIVSRATREIEFTVRDYRAAVATAQGDA